MKGLIDIFKTQKQAIEIEEIHVDSLVQQIDECINFRIFEIQPTIIKQSKTEDAYFVIKIERSAKTQN